MGNNISKPIVHSNSKYVSPYDHRPRREKALRNIENQLRNVRATVVGMVTNRQNDFLARVTSATALSDASNKFLNWYNSAPVQSGQMNGLRSYCLEQAINSPVYRYVVLRFIQTELDSVLFELREKDQGLNLTMAMRHLQDETYTLLKYCWRELIDTFDPVSQVIGVRGRRGLSNRQFWAAVQKINSQNLKLNDTVVWILLQLGRQCGANDFNNAKPTLNDLIQHLDSHEADKRRFHSDDIEQILDILKVIKILLGLVDKFRVMVTDLERSPCPNGAECGLHGFWGKTESHGDEEELRPAVQRVRTKAAATRFVTEWSATTKDSSLVAEVASILIDGLRSYFSSAGIRCAPVEEVFFMIDLLVDEGPNRALDSAKYESPIYCHESKDRDDAVLMESSGQEEAAKSFDSTENDETQKLMSVKRYRGCEQYTDQALLQSEYEQQRQITDQEDVADPSRPSFSSADCIDTTLYAKIPISTPSSPDSSKNISTSKDVKEYEDSSETAIIERDDDQGPDILKNNPTPIPNEQTIVGPRADHLDVPRRRWIFEDPRMYKLLRQLIPAPGSPQRRSAMLRTEFLRLITSPPLNFEVMRSKGVSMRLVRREDNGSELATTIHSPHSGRWMEVHILVKVQGDIKQLLQAEAEDFVLREEAEMER